MRRNWLKWLFTFDGRVSRVEYLIAGLLLAALKYGIDWSLMRSFGFQLHLWTYELPSLTIVRVWTPATE